MVERARGMGLRTMFADFFGHPTKTGVTRHEGSPRLRAIVTGPSRRVLLICPRAWPHVCPVERKL